MSVAEDLKPTFEILKQKFLDLETSIDAGILQTVEEYYNKVANVMLPIAIALISAWIIYKALKIMFAPSSSGALDGFIQQSLKMIAIIVFAFAWEYVFKYLANPIVNGVPELVGKMTGENTDSLILQFVTNMIANVNTSFSLTEGAEQLIAVILVGIICFIISLLVLVNYFFTVFWAKIMIALLLIITPIFFTFLMFESTRNWCMNWVNAMMHNVMTLLLLNLIVGFISKLMLVLMANTQGAQTGTTLIMSFVVCGFGYLMFLFVKKAGDISSQLVSSGFGLHSESGERLQQGFNRIAKKGAVSAGQGIKTGTIKAKNAITSRFSK